MALRAIPPNLSHTLSLTRILQCSRSVAIKCQNIISDDHALINQSSHLKTCLQLPDVRNIFAGCIPKEVGFCPRTRKHFTHNENTDCEGTIIDNHAKPFTLTSDDIILRKTDNVQFCSGYPLSTSDRLVSESARPSNTSGNNNCNTLLKDLDNYLVQCMNSCHVTYCTQHGSPEGEPNNDKKPKRATLEQLSNVKEYFVLLAPIYFNEGREINDMYDRNVTLENNFFQKKTIHRGISMYMLQMLKYRTIVYMKYTGAVLGIRNVTINQDESCVKIHWRITGDPVLQMFRKLWPGSNQGDSTQFFEGLSYFYVGTNGRVSNHRVERMMTDEGPPKKNRIARLAALFGLAPQTGQQTFIGLFMKRGNSAITI